MPNISTSSAQDAQPRTPITDDGTGCTEIEEPRAMPLIKKERTALKRRRREYRCPACGQTVDNGEPEAVREHHAHVLYARPSTGLPPVVPLVPEMRQS
jgi:hypothetical protein